MKTALGSRSDAHRDMRSPSRVEGRLKVETRAVRRGRGDRVERETQDQRRGAGEAGSGLDTLAG